MLRDHKMPNRAKAFFTFLLFAGSLSSFATDYYVSPSGNDSNNGTSPATAWQTIDRLNQSFNLWQPGDRI
ncbi:MAG: hypothetical protein WBB32_05075, partial [Flavobacteriales bacterium]